MPSTRLVPLLGLLALASTLACARSEGPPPALGLATERAAATVATFEGSFEPGKGLTIKTTPMAAPGVLGSWVAAEPFQDGTAGSGPEDSFELVTEAELDPPGTDPNGCAEGVPDFHGTVTLRSFFKTQAFTDVAVELTSVSTGFEACGDDTPGAGSGMSGDFGFWDYGTIAVGDSNTRKWRFHLGGDQGFTFRGRIMAQAATLPIPPSGATEFDWRPYMFAYVPHSFEDVGTTVAHVLWNGSAFEDKVGSLSFQRVGGGAPSVSIGMTYPEQPYTGWDGVSGFSATSYYQASGSFNLTGDFTVCAKFKPGVNPGTLERKVIVAKGNPIEGGGEGWALTQQHGPVPSGTPQYGFFYRTASDPINNDSFVGPGNNPELSTFDYTCAGRNGNGIRVVAHGRDTNTANTTTGAFSNPGALPLVIGAAAGGNWPALDDGVYEVIFDSRAATVEVMNEIVDGAEGQRTYNGASEWGNNVDALPVAGADGAIYHFPVGSTAPVSTDGSGLLDAGKTLAFGGTNSFQAPVLPGSPGAFCVGAEVVSASWSSAAGCVLGDTNGYLKIFFLGSTDIGATTGKDQFVYQYGSRTGWAPNSRHRLVVCTPGPLAAAAAATLYVDGTQAGATTSTGPQFNLTTGQLQVGTCYNGPLTGARIGRVFACPTSDHTACQ